MLKFADDSRRYDNSLKQYRENVNRPNEGEVVERRRVRNSPHSKFTPKHSHVVLEIGHVVRQGDSAILEETARAVDRRAQ